MTTCRAGGPPGAGRHPAPSSFGAGPERQPQELRRSAVVITEVRIKLVAENNERLMAFCSLTLDNAFVIRDLKIIEGTKGLFVAMPSRKLSDRCGKCGCKNHLRARFCNSCGGRRDGARAPRMMAGGAKLHADIPHPIHSAAREQIQSSVVKAYTDEKERAKLP